MSIIKKIVSGILVGACFSSPIYAFDDKREGFMVSLGAGVALSSTDFSSAYEGWGTGRAKPELGLATSFKVGYGVSESYTVFLFRNSAFVHGYSKDPDKKTYGNCVTGLGLNYYPDYSDYYLIAGVGMGQLSKLDDSENEAKRGFGGVAGIGYKYTDHIQFEASYLATRVDDDGIKLSTDALHMTLNYYFY